MHMSMALSVRAFPPAGSVLGPDAAPQHTYFAPVHSTERTHLLAELEKAAGAVREAGADRKEARREAMMTEAVEGLKRLYPHGTSL